MSTTLPMVTGTIEPHACRPRQLQAIARRARIGSEGRCLAPGTEDRLERFGHLTLRAPSSRAVDQGHHELGARLPSCGDQRRERGCGYLGVALRPGPLERTPLGMLRCHRDLQNLERLVVRPGERVDA